MGMRGMCECMYLTAYVSSPVLSASLSPPLPSPPLLVVEIYCGAFGNCQVVLPTINQIMLTIDDADDKLKWLVINVAKLEEEQRHLLAEEEKKKAEMESVHRR